MIVKYLDQANFFIIVNCFRDNIIKYKEFIAQLASVHLTINPYLEDTLYSIWPSETEHLQYMLGMICISIFPVYL